MERRGRRDVEDLEDRQRDAVQVAGLLVTVELHGVQAEACGDGRHLASRSVGEDADEERSVAGGIAGPGGSGRLSRLLLVQRPRGAGHEVEADGVRAARHGGRQPRRLRDTADLDEGGTAIGGRVYARRRHEPAAP